MFSSENVMNEWQFEHAIMFSMIMLHMNYYCITEIPPKVLQKYFDCFSYPFFMLIFIFWLSIFFVVIYCFLKFIIKSNFIQLNSIKSSTL